MICPCCNGTGEVVKAIKDTPVSERRRMAIELHSNGFRYREIMELLGYQSTAGIHNLLKRKNNDR